MTANDTKAVKAYFRNSSRFGRTTQLVEKSTGRVLLEGLGDCSRSLLWKQYQLDAAK